LTDAAVITHGGPLRTMLDLALVSWPAMVPRRLAPADVVRLAHDEEWKIDTFWSAEPGVRR
jgi:hypothetical protein